MRTLFQFRLSLATISVTTLFSATNAAATTALVTFDPPGISQGYTTYVAAGAQQTVTTTPATFTGGVILGFATFLPAIAYATPPNVYGTANFGVNLSQTLDISVNAAFATNQVSFALFNGETFAQSYVATAYNGATVVASQTLSNVAANFNSGYGLIDLQAPSITKVVVAAVGAPTVWDFLIDTVAFNQTATQAVSTPSITVSPPVVTTPASPPVVTPPPPPVVVVQPPAPPVFVPPAPVLVNDNGNEVELELNYGDSIDGQATLNSLNNMPTPSPAPEPSTWAMMILGVGAVGMMVSRRRRAEAAARLAQSC